MNRHNMLFALALLLPLAATADNGGAGDLAPDDIRQSNIHLAAEQPSGQQPGQPGVSGHATAEAEEEQPYRALLQRSPFLTRAYLEQQRRARSRGGAQLAFHGYFRADDETWMFSVLNRRDQTSHWVTIGDMVGNTTITAFDPRSQQLTVTSEETSSELPLSRPEN